MAAPRDTPIADRVGSTFIYVMVSSVVVLSYAAALQAWPKFLEGFADDVCGSGSVGGSPCSDELFRSYAVPIAGALIILGWAVAVVAIRKVSSWSERRSVTATVVSCMSVLTGIYVVFTLAPPTRSATFAIAALAWAILAATLVRAGGAHLLWSIAAYLVAPWPLVAFALAYPTPG